MKVQRITVGSGSRWILLDDDYRPVKLANGYLKMLDAKNYSPNTLRSYAYGLKRYYQYLNAVDASPLDIYRDDGATILDLLVDFTLFLNGTYGPQNVIHYEGTPFSLSEETLSTTLSSVIGFYEYLTLEHAYRDLNLHEVKPARWDDAAFLAELIQSRRLAKKRALERKRVSGDVPYVTREQVSILVDACHSLRDKLLVDLMFNTGIRVSEALGIHLSDISLEDGRVDIVFRPDNENGARVKNYAQRRTYPPPYTLALCRDYLIRESLRYKSDYLFVSMKGPSSGRALSYESAKKLFASLSERTGIEVHSHMLRHGFAVERLEDGHPIEDIALMMGHKNISSTRIYLSITKRLERERLRPMMDREKFLLPDGRLC